MKKIGVIIGGGLLFLGGMLLHKKISAKTAELEYQELKNRLSKFEDYFAISNKWLKNRNQGISVAEFFRRNHYEKIAIYGMGEIGRRLYEELQLEGIKVEFVFDRNAQRVDPKLNVCSIDKKIPPVDVIVITPVFDYESIEEKLKSITKADIISIKDAILS